MNGRRIGLVVLLLALIGGGVVLGVVLTKSDEEDIFLEGKDDIGPNPFTTIAQISPTTTTIPDATSTSSGTTTTIGFEVTTTTALFGGSGDQKVCDPEALITFLTTNTSHGQAWIDALNSDPTLQWTGGSKLTLTDIPTYIRELTPTFLTQDTRVTNHGFVNGKATPRQSVLQAGTAVLVDSFGIPRVRCACGNPLIPPEKVDNPNYEGECWPGCHDHPYCSPPNCHATTTTELTTTSSPETTTTCVVTPGAAGCVPVRTTTTRRPTVTRPPIVTTTTRPPTVITTTSTTAPATTTTQPSTVSSTTSTTQGQQPPG